ncbi:HAD family phosphatase [Streptomyces sp. HNM0574]|nr:HAD family phosphatase [Streptomyces sp. HNM0574]
MDGTLVDTERDWLAGIAGLLAAHGAPADEPDVLPFAGLTLRDAADRLGTLLALSETETAALADRLDRDFTARITAGVTLRPGALRLLDHARELGVPVALVTASERPVADLVLSATLGSHRFDHSVASGESGRDKPHPDPYAAAARALGAATEDCLAVEDTPTGAAAALAAGCHVLAVPTVPGIAADPRVHFARSLEDVTLTGPPRSARG